VIALLLLAAGCDKSADSASCAEGTFWPDEDGDGYGALGAPIEACTLPADASATSDDCDDGDASVHPGADEICDDKDTDCDGTGDVLATWYPDRDGDGYGDMLGGEKACVATDGAVGDGTDCDDGDASVHPGAVEECDGDDDDCNGRDDVGAVGTWYADEDGDGYGDDATGTETCDPDPTWVDVGGDCEPANGDAHPGASEVCNAYDDDCDGDTLACGYAGDHDLADAPTKLVGSASDDAGRLLEAGDFDGDGDGDVVVPTLYANHYGGGGYIVDGPPPLGEHVLADVAVTITGGVGTMGGGRSIGVADTNADGFDDVGFGAAWLGGDDVFVIHGPIAADMDLVDADVDLQGPDGSYTGHGHDLGDVTGDAIGDAVIGAYAEAGNRGVIYVMNGPLSGTRDLETESDAILSGDEVNAWAGRVVRCGGDLDGDGVGDLLAPAPYASTGGPLSGKVFVVLGPPSGDAELADVAYAQLVGESANAIAGNDVAMADVDGDGLDDSIVTSPLVEGGHVNWVSGLRSGVIDLGDADGIIAGDTTGMDLGANVDAKDIDGDGRAEILAGATGVASDRGEVYLFYAPIVGTIGTADAAATFAGERGGDFAGQGVAFADVDGDTSTEILVGAPNADTGAGSVYVFFPE
jgi:hypothetical protein